MEQEVIKAGIIGSGFAARFHYEALRRVFSTKIEIIGAYSKSPEELIDFTKERGIRIFDSMEQLINECDVLHVCTPPVTHEPIAIAVLKQNKDVIIEKPFTGYFGDGSKDFNGDEFPREIGLKHAVESIQRMLKAEKESKGSIMYAENWVYAPAIQKEREVIEKTGAQILWIQAQQSHSGSHSRDYGKWRLAGGGSLMGKGAHPLSAAIYLKHAEGIARNGSPIHPKTISARVHSITRLPNFQNHGHLKDSYTDIEDYATTHIVFEDGTIADITASELLLGGVKNYIEIHANNHRTVCNITPNNAMQTYNPVEENFKDIYVVEKTGTKQGWSNMSPDEAWFNGYQHEMDAFYKSAASGSPIESNSSLASDVIATIYAAYVSAERKGAETNIIILK
ncbi:MAG: Gfo/Idh/MocA family oxidoreductase [Bacteroidales bacterium]|nr:Gfo/Idh/MocA family oxidoreductase [Bacteroidales bacterium]MCF8390127.1 Gfo/Idh/MocA family oxidoreductase [Bacteroidales bacterium]